MGRWRVSEDRTPSGEYVFSAIEKVSFGPGSVEQLPDELDRLMVKRALLVTTGSVVATPLAERVAGLVGDRLAGRFSDVHQHTPAGDVVALARAAESIRADLLLSLGGGSVIDAVKAAILALARDTGNFLPHIALPTTLSAAEFSDFFGVTEEETRVKSGAKNPLIQPQYVILDADLTAHTPEWLWLGSGIRALDHAVETVYAPNHQPATDATALEAIRLLFRYLPPSRDQSASDARQHCQIAAWLSFFGIANITLGLSHALGREIGPRYNVPHGYTSAVLLPKVMSYLLPETLDRQALVARAAGVDTGGMSEGDAALEAPEAVGNLVRTLGLPQRLRDLSVPQADLPALAGKREAVLHVLQEAW